jgi:hypothetical protein
VKSRTTRGFWTLFARLSKSVQNQARAAHRRFEENPYYPGLHFKQIHPTRPIYSARVSKDYRVVGVMREDAIVWFWIGTHAAYDRLRGRL